jgi:flagellar motor switch protein FliM
VLPFKPQVLRFESDPRMAAIANPSDVTILCAFEVTGPIDGRLMLAIPYAAVESAKKALSSPPRLGGQRDLRFGQALAHELELVEVELRVEVGRYHLRMSDLLGLKVGDVVTLNTSEGSPLPVMVQERPKMTALPKVLAGGIAVEILKTIPRPAAAAAPPARPARQHHTTQAAA